MSPELQEIATRLKEARRRLEAAQAQTSELFGPGAESPDTGYAYRQAIQAETAALREYARILREYGDCARKP